MNATSATIGLTFLVVLAGCAGKGSDLKVEVDDSYFEPEAKTIKAGQELKFENEGKIDHTVTIHFSTDPANQTLKDSTIRPGGDTEFKFEKAGTYHVWCKFHGQMTSGMHMTVTVNA